MDFNATVAVTYSSFTGNSATMNGQYAGGVRVLFPVICALALARSTSEASIDSLVCLQYGGAIYIYGSNEDTHNSSTQCTLTISFSSFKNNQATIVSITVSLSYRITRQSRNGMCCRD